MSDVMAANPQHYSMGGFSYGTLCNATASPVPPSQMGVCELFNQVQFEYYDVTEKTTYLITYTEITDDIGAKYITETVSPIK